MDEGPKLALAKASYPNIPAFVWVIPVRFVTIPRIALLFVWGMAGRGLYVDDKSAWWA